MFGYLQFCRSVNILKPVLVPRFPFTFFEDLHQDQEIPVHVFLFGASVLVSGVFLRDTQRSGLQSAVLAPNGCLSTPHEKDR